MAKLLLVEDDNNLREIYEARLQAEGYNIVTAKDGEEALVVAKAEHPDLVISDVMMPKISGFEMLDILRNTENLKSVPVIMLTALGQNDDQRRADKLGADRYLVKSQVTLEDIVKTAHELLGDASSGATSTTSVAAAGPTPTPTPTPTAPATVTASTPTATPVTVATPAISGVAAVPPTNPVNVAANPTATQIPTSAASTNNTTTATTPVIAPTAEQPSTNTTVTPATTAASTGNSPATPTNTSTDMRIEDFVAGATEEANPPIATPVINNSEPVQSAPSTPDQPAVDISVATNNSTTETTMSTANQSEPATTPPLTPESTVNNPPENDTNPNTEKSMAPKTETAPEEETVTSPVVHDKVIKPLEADPKKDINTLLALEAVKEADSKPEVQTAPIVGDVMKPSNDIAPETPTEDSTIGPVPEPSSVVTPAETDKTTKASDDNGETVKTDFNSIAL